MCTPDVGQDTDGRLDDGAQGFHLTHFGDTGFEDAQLGVLVHEPYGERHTDLGVIASWRTGNDTVRTEQLVQPFFDDRFSITSRDADDRHLKLFPVLGSQALQTFQWVGYNQKIGILVGGSRLRYFIHDEIAYSLLVKVWDVFMSVVTFCLQGKKQSFFRKTQRPAVCKYPVNGGGGVSFAFSPQDGGYFFNCA